MMPESSEMSYEERSVINDPPTVVEERVRGDMRTTFRFFGGYDDMKTDQELQNQRTLLEKE